MSWSADIQLKNIHKAKLLNIILNTQYNNDKRIDRLYNDLLAIASNKDFVDFQADHTPFINFLTAHEELTNDDDLFKLGKVLDWKSEKYKMREKTPTWESIKTEEVCERTPFVFKFACLSREGQPLSIDDQSYYKVWVKLKGRRLVNLWDYAVALFRKDVDLHAHRVLFSTLLAIQDLAQQSIAKQDMLTDLPKIYVSNVNYDVPWLHFNFVCGPVRGNYRCQYTKPQPVVHSSIPKKKEFMTALTNGRIPSMTHSQCCDIENDLTLLLSDGREYNDKNPYKGAILNILPQQLTESWVKGTILFGTIMFVADNNDSEDVAVLDFYIEMAGKMIKEMFNGISSVVSGILSTVAVLYVQVWQLYKFKYWETNELNKDWRTYLRACSGKCMAIEHKYDFLTLSSIFAKYFWTDPIRKLLEESSKPLEDHEILHASMFGLRAEKSVLNT